MKIETFIGRYIKADVAWTTAVVLPPLLLALYLGWLMFSSPFSRADFDQQAWAALTAANDNNCERGAMLDSLLKKHVQIGMQKSKIVALLGKPDKDNGGVAFYYLGYCQTFTDEDTLDFYFDSQGALTKHAITTH